MKAFIFFEQSDSGEGWWDENGAVVIAEDLGSAKKLLLSALRKRKGDAATPKEIMQYLQVIEKDLGPGLIAAFGMRGSRYLEDIEFLRMLYPGMKIHGRDPDELTGRWSRMDESKKKRWLKS